MVGVSQLIVEPLLVRKLDSISSNASTMCGDPFDDSPWQSPNSTPRSRMCDISSLSSAEGQPRTEACTGSMQLPCNQQTIATPVPCNAQWVIFVTPCPQAPYQQAPRPQAQCLQAPCQQAPCQQVPCQQAPCPQAPCSSQAAVNPTPLPCNPIRGAASRSSSGTGSKETSQASTPQTQTTLTIRNLPNHYTREMALELLDSHGFAGRYDFFYLPFDFQTHSNLGYAFVNFVSHAEAEHVMSMIHGFCDWDVPSRKILEVDWSQISQGLETNIERYRSSSVFHPSVPDEFQPLLFSQGVRIPFPAPTKPIRQPCLKPNPPLSLTPRERIERTISIINGGDIEEIASDAKSTLSHELTFLCPDVFEEMRSIPAVCTFLRRLLECIPDLQITLEYVRKVRTKAGGEVLWRATCTGTQIRKFIPGLPIDARASFVLGVTEKVKSNGMPSWLSWNFEVGAQDAAGIAAKELLHRRGECSPCAYFAFRSDGCRAGGDCEYCHLCTKSQAKSRKKQKEKAQRQKVASVDADSNTIA